MTGGSRKSSREPASNNGGSSKESDAQATFLRSPWTAAGSAMLIGAFYAGGQTGGSGYLVGTALGFALLLYVPIRLVQRFLPETGVTDSSGFPAIIGRLWLVICVLPALLFGGAGAAFLGDTHTPGEIGIAVMILGPGACLACYHLGLWIVRGSRR